jgi:hypothetical protein
MEVSFHGGLVEKLPMEEIGGANHWRTSPRLGRMIQRAASWSRAARKEIGLHLDSPELGKNTKNSLLHLALGKMENGMKEGRGAHPWPG